MKYFKSIGVLLVLSVIVFFIAYTPLSTSAAKNEGENGFSYFSKHIKFVEKYIGETKELESTEYEAWFNDVGEFRFNVISGSSKGDFQVWDGKKLYQYTSAINEMVVRDFVNNDENGVVIPHEIFSFRLIETIKKNIDNGKFKKLKNGEYSYDSAEGEKIKYKLDDNQKMLLESELYLNNDFVHSRAVEVLENIDSFDITLFKVDLKDMEIVNME